MVRPVSSAGASDSVQYTEAVAGLERYSKTARVLTDGHAPKVGVVCVTYNHAPYIEQALNSFLGQKTTFPVRIVVADDGSTDGTRDILKRYADAHDCIELLFPEEHHGAERNLIDAVSIASTPYVALCDGDDYWCDPSKLQVQYDLMEANPCLRACFHDTEIVVESDRKWIFADDYQGCKDGKMRWWSGHVSYFKKDVYTIEDYIPYGFVHSSSMFFRWDPDLRIPEWYFTHQLGDYTLWCLQVGLGEFGFIDRTMSVYRRWGKSAFDFKSRSQFWRRTRADWIDIDKDLMQHFKVLGAPKGLIDKLNARLAADRKKWLAGKVLGIFGR